MLGVVKTSDALRMAQEAELESGRSSSQCRSASLPGDEFREVSLRADQERAGSAESQTKIEVKEIRLRPKTNEHHRGFKVRDARRWLEDGMKVKVRIRFRGREITYPEIALNDLKAIAEDLSDIAIVEQIPSLEGQSMLMILAPSKIKKK